MASPALARLQNFLLKDSMQIGEKDRGKEGGCEVERERRRGIKRGGKRQREREVSSEKLVHHPSSFLSLVRLPCACAQILRSYFAR
jgi:hypothetical protein